MAKKSKEVKYVKLLKKSKYSTRVRSRCPLCGRPRAYMRDFNMCRICFRRLAQDGMIAGLTKASW
jgi:small subunit ribosomal protein S14